MKRRILVVEDDPRVCELVRACLEPEGFEVTVAHNGTTGLNMALNDEQDLIVLDIMLPGTDGWEICRALASSEEHASVPVLMLTAKGAEVDRVLGLELGADDYIVKPFSPRELVARIRALLRRVDRAGDESSATMAFGCLTLDAAAYRAYAGDRVVDFTPREFELLHFLASHPNQVLSREQILEHVWGAEYCGTTRTVDEHIKRLRNKLDRAAGLREAIGTVWGVGYRFDPDSACDPD